MRKIKLIDPQWPIGYARSGWAYAVSALQHLHSDNGILFDSFIEKKFVWAGPAGWPPYRKPWIGVFHNPPYVPAWYGTRNSAEDIIASLLWCESLPYCRGLFTLSNYLAAWLRPRVTVPINSLYHPTDPDTEQFSMDKYHRNKNRMIIHIGYWLRKIHSFFLVRTHSLQKMLLLPMSQRELSCNRPWLKALLITERLIAERNLANGADIQPFKIEFHKDNDSYDYLLSRNIVFIDLYDSSANNTIVECIMRNTPIVINRHPAVIEYLGENYPLYFNTNEEASHLAEDEQQVHAAYIYLRDHYDIKERLTKKYFETEFTNSAIYQNLPCL
jgi:hypothetical protein